MRKRDTQDTLMALAAVLTDAVAVYLAFMLAWWIRFSSGWIAVTKGVPPFRLYLYAAFIGAVLYVLIYGSLGLYRRPQTGNFVEKIPRLVRANAIGLLVSLALFSVIRTEPPFSRLAVAISFGTTTALITTVRLVLFHIEIAVARRTPGMNRVAVLGSDHVAARLRRALEADPRLRSRVVAFFPVSMHEPDPAIPDGLLASTLDTLPPQIEEGAFDEVILTDTSLSHPRMVEIILHCEKHLVGFHLVPDLFRLLTSSVDVQTVDGVPLLGVGRWPLDYFWNRLLKRTEDVVCAVLVLVVSAPIIAISATCIKATSPGPIFYRQERFGERGRCFTMIKLRSMPVDAEAETGPAWTHAEDPRRTRVGRVLRRYNIDELPQLWNVLVGDMSLVGPRPERPYFVDQFKEELGNYMWRHVHRPGMTGWAQVNGLRGDTSIPDRVKHDLYYLENWSLAFDFKIMLMTLFSRKNAY